MLNMDILSHVVALFVLYILWKKTYQKALFEYKRTLLLRIRLDTRVYFKKNNISTENELYKELCDLIDCAQKNIEKVTLYRVISNAQNVNNERRKIRAITEQDMLKKYSEELQAVYKKQQNEVFSILKSCMVERNAFLLSIALLLFVFVRLLLLLKRAPESEDTIETCQYGKVKESFEERLIPKSKMLATLS